MEQHSSRPHEPIPPVIFGFVAHADLAHFHAQAQVSRQVPDKTAKIHPLLAREVECGAIAAAAKIGAKQLDGQAQRAGAFAGKGQRLLLASPILPGKEWRNSD